MNDRRADELAAEIHAEAQLRLDDQGLNASVIQVDPLADGFQIIMVVPKLKGETNGEWHARVRNASELLGVIEGVSGVHLEITKMGGH